MDKYIIMDIETTGLNPLNSFITCICAKSSDNVRFKVAKRNERELIKGFLRWIKGINANLIISANGKDFDMPFIFMRAFINDIKYREVRFLEKIARFDLINDITDRRISLDNILRLYKLKTKTGNGLNAIKLYQEGKYFELMDYCMNDVEATEKAYLVFKELKYE